MVNRFRAMETPVGRALRETKTRGYFALAIAAAIIVTDFAIVRRVSFEEQRLARLGMIAAALVLYALAARGHWPSLGLRCTLAPGWRYWLKAVLIIAGIILAAGLVCGLTAIVVGYDLSAYRLFDSPGEFWDWLWPACVVAPVLEEGLYRFILCTAVVAVAPPWVAVVLSGAIFAGLHFVYGNPGPDNFLAGYFLAWTYLRSGSILLPVALHALGNLCVGLIQVANCWF